MSEHAKEMPASLSSQLETRRESAMQAACIGLAEIGFDYFFQHHSLVPTIFLADVEKLLDEHHFARRLPKGDKPTIYNHLSLPPDRKQVLEKVLQAATLLQNQGIDLNKLAGRVQKLQLALNEALFAVVVSVPTTEQTPQQFIDMLWTAARTFWQVSERD